MMLFNILCVHCGKFTLQPAFDKCPACGAKRNIQARYDDRWAAIVVDCGTCDRDCTDAGQPQNLRSKTLEECEEVRYESA